MSESDSPPEEPMRYGMLGEDSMSEAEKIAKYSGDADWEYLEPHFKKEALLWVDLSLDLQVVGEAFANDDSKAVATWKKAGDLVVPSQPHADYWAASHARFKAVVVQPFVLIQPLPEEKD